MSANELKKELVSYIQNINDEELLSLLKEDFVFYGKVKDADITDGLNEDQLRELKTLADEDESKDIQTLDEFKKTTEKMAYQVVVKKRFTNKVSKVLAYLEKEWSHQIASEFLLKIDRRIELLIKQPYIGALSLKVNDVRGLLITRHNKMYYKIKDDKVIVLNMYDTRLDPKKNPY